MSGSSIDRSDLLEMAIQILMAVMLTLSIVGATGIRSRGPAAPVLQTVVVDSIPKGGH